MVCLFLTQAISVSIQVSSKKKKIPLFNPQISSDVVNISICPLVLFWGFFPHKDATQYLINAAVKTLF